MIKREGEQFGMSVFIYDFGSIHLKFHKIDPILQAISEMSKEEIKNRLKSSRCVYVQIRGAAQHAHCGQQAENTEKMIAVDMGQAYMFYLQEGHACPAQLHLRALTTVNHK
jgi:hypothetical protein